VPKWKKPVEKAVSLGYVLGGIPEEVTEEA
jgi:hypothetical protein